jgi:hypothetical protein
LCVTDSDGNELGRPLKRGGSQKTCLDTPPHFVGVIWEKALLEGQENWVQPSKRITLGGFFCAPGIGPIRQAFSRVAGHVGKRALLLGIDP